ncbi:MAG TPA: histidine kinase dimerization/phospho-acceptor domain-containing protein [Candidatus Angelobacter sp.]|nr:histidine kinase dimerization/phospho-acceptor domain-containing protein [Candidatus Angelobacter sp.]
MEDRDQSTVFGYTFPAADCISQGQLGKSIAIQVLWLAACNQVIQRRYQMALTKRQLIGELKHEINSPLAAIRNALYLAAVRTGDAEIQRYLRLADDEASRISQILKNANQMDENKRVYELTPCENAALAA